MNWKGLRRKRNWDIIPEFYWIDLGASRENFIQGNLCHDRDSKGASLDYKSKTLNIILHLHPGLPSGLFPARFLTKLCLQLSPVHSCYIPCPNHARNCNNRYGKRIQSMKPESGTWARLIFPRGNDDSNSDSRRTENRIKCLGTVVEIQFRILCLLLCLKTSRRRYSETSVLYGFETWSHTQNEGNN